jgi:hypothetical protein
VSGREQFQPGGEAGHRRSITSDEAMSISERHPYPVGASITLEELDADPHAAHHRLRATEPVSWLPSLEGWLVTRHDLALAAMRDAATFTVDDPRFSTAQVIGPSMLSLDGEAHDRHRAPFTGPFRPAAVKERFTTIAEQEAQRLAALVGSAPDRRSELRRAFAAPMAATIVTRSLGLSSTETADVLGWYDTIVASVTSITAGNGPTAAGTQAFAQLRERLQGVIGGADTTSLLAVAAAADTPLTDDQIASNAAVLLFGGIETTDGMIANALHMLLQHPDDQHAAAADPGTLDAAIDESLRLEPAAAVIDRYATADTTLGDARIGTGDLVRLSLAAANRDPAVFADPDAYDLTRGRRGNLAFAQGPHVCVGVHLARLEARTAVAALLNALPGLRLDPDRPATVTGLVFRKPQRLDVLL